MALFWWKEACHHSPNNSDFNQLNSIAMVSLCVCINSMFKLANIFKVLIFILLGLHVVKAHEPERGGDWRVVRSAVSWFMFMDESSVAVLP